MLIISLFVIFLFFKGSKETYESLSESDARWLAKQEGQLNSWGQASLKLDNRDNGNLSKIKIAIMDSGIDKKHEDLVGKVIKEYNAINPKEKIEDVYGHGTAVAGIIAANDNNQGIRGILPNAELYSIKVISDNGKGNIESLAKGIDWAIKNKVDLINISFGMPNDKPKLKAAVNKAVKAGIIIVASTGNKYGLNSDYPASYNNVISVNAINSDLKITSFSAKGKINFVAPGTGIVTTILNNNYGVVEGTSIATAYVTGTIGYILAYKEKFNIPEKGNSNYFNELLKVLEDNSLELGDKNIYGNGLIQLKGVIK